MGIRREVIPWAVGGLLPASLFYFAWLLTGNLFALLGFVLFAALSVFFLYFFRDPRRQPETAEENDWLSPADGIVRAVEEEEDGRLRLVIFLTIFNVHLNRMPVKGKVISCEYKPGRYLPAFAEATHLENERNILRCQTKTGEEFEIWQVAGLLARRIHCWVDAGEKLGRGDRFGMIALGSRTDLILPRDAEVNAAPGDLVRAGQTVIARTTISEEGTNV